MLRRTSNPSFTSPVDPAARWTAASNGPAVYAYADNYLIDLKCAVILDVEPTTAVRQAEVTAAKRMITRTAERLGMEPARLAADTGYGSAEMLAWLVEERGIEPHIPVFDKSARKDGSLSRNRPDLVATEEAEIAVIESFLPQPMDDAALTAAVDAAIAETGAASQFPPQAPKRKRPARRAVSEARPERAASPSWTSRVGV